MFSRFLKEIYRAPFSSLDSFPDPPFSAEDALLVNCARSHVSAKKVEENLNSGLDWEYITSTAINHRIAPLLYYNLREIDDSLVPSEAKLKLQDAYVDTLGRGYLAQNELRVVLKLLLDARIQVIVLKGLALAQTVYPNIALRPFTDIDLLVSLQNRHRTLENLYQLGYDVSHDHRPGFAMQFRDSVCYIKGKVLPIDLHWHVAKLPYSRYIPIDQFWESAVPLNIKGVDALVLSPEDLLIYLCIHIAKEHYSLLIWLVDISEVIYHYSGKLDWELVMEKTHLYKIDSLMRYVLCLVKVLFSAPVPSFTLERLNSYRAASFEERLFDVLADPDVSDIKWDMAQLLTTPGFVPRMRFLFGKLFPDRNYVIERYPNGKILRSRLTQGGHKFGNFVRTSLCILRQTKLWSFKNW